MYMCMWYVCVSVCVWVGGGGGGGGVSKGRFIVRRKCLQICSLTNRFLLTYLCGTVYPARWPVGLLCNKYPVT